MVDDVAEVIEDYRRYGASFEGEEPVYAELCARLGEFPELAAVVAAHEPAARQPNLLFAAVHFLVLGGLDHPLADAYDGALRGDVAALFADCVLANREAVDELLAVRRTQTNEVGRSAVLALMLLAEHRRSGLPLSWVDLGASAGLNLNCDRYRVDYAQHDGDTRSIGPADARVRLRSEVRRGRPPIEPGHAPIGWRLGVDRAPIDTTDPIEARWLRACLWPSRDDRRARLDAALAVASETPPPLFEADAVAGLEHALALAPGDTALVVSTTWVWYYLSVETRRAAVDVMCAAGRPIAWYSLEGRGVVEALGLGPHVDVDRSVTGVVYLDGSAAPRSRIFGPAHPHGAWLEWD